MWEEVLDIFSRFSSCDFSFLDGYNSWVCVSD